MGQTFDPYHKWLGIPPEEQPPNHYRLLAIKDLEADPDVIQAAADQRMAHLRTYQTGRYAEWSQRLLNEVAAAKICLLNEAKKTAYDQRLQESLRPKPPAVQPPEPMAAPDPPFVIVAEVKRPRASSALRRRRRSPLGALIGAAMVMSAVVAVEIVYLNIESQEMTRPVVPQNGSSNDRNSKPAVTREKPSDKGKKRPKESADATPTTSEADHVSPSGSEAQLALAEAARAGHTLRARPSRRNHPGPRRIAIDATFTITTHLPCLYNPTRPASAGSARG